MKNRILLLSRGRWDQSGNLIFLNTFKAICLIGLALSAGHSALKASTELTADRIIQLETYVVEGEDTASASQLIDQQSLNLPKIVDLSEVISSELIEASMVRKSGYGNEINLRGFSQANLPVLINGGFIEGACGSRKDPALSHINLLTVDRLVIREGPFDVLQPGSLGGYVNVITKGPEQAFGGEVLARAGSYDFYSAGFSATSGTQAVQVRVGYNYSESGQYEDGDGTALWELRNGRSESYNEAGQSAEAFRKQDMWGAVNIDLSATHTLAFDYAWGDARDILTSRVAFDTGKETTRLMRLRWIAEQLGTLSETLKVSLYRNDIGHYPTQKYRNVSVPKNVISKTTLSGLKIQNATHLGDHALMIGADLTRRKWNADVFNATTGAVMNGIMIPATRDENWGFFARVESDRDTWNWSAGLRIDQHKTEADTPLTLVQRLSSENENEDTLLGGFATLRYRTDDASEFYMGLGRSYRVPNGAERYIQGGPTFIGNPELEPTANTEFDIGWIRSGEHWRLQAKAFYSDLKDYIYQVYTSDGIKTYRNIDAHILGGDITASWFWKNGFSIDAGVARHRGKKDSQPNNNADTDLGQMAPLKYRVAANLERESTLFGARFMQYSTLECTHGDASRDVDTDAGEKSLDSWTTVNLRFGLRSTTWSCVCGIDNLFDETYAVANSYEWDVVGGASSDPLIVNEPGRFIYFSLGYNW